jgi:hypothetical protein
MDQFQYAMVTILTIGATGGGRLVGASLKQVIANKFNQWIG